MPRRNKVPYSTTKSNLSVWLPSVVPLVLVCISGITAYTDVTKSIAIMQIELTTLKEGDIQLDKYDRYLQRQTEKNERRLLVVETKQTDIISTQARLEVKLDRVLTEMTNVNNAIVRLVTLQESQNKKEKE